jgi:DNA-binding NarL/FixJ family response regulator
MGLNCPVEKIVAGHSVQLASSEAATALAVDRYTRVVGRHMPQRPSARNSNGKIGVLIADREGVFRFGLKRLLAAEDDLHVVAEIDEPGDLLPQIRELQPDVVLVQAEMLGAVAEASLAEICKGSTASKIVVTASALDEDESLAFMKAGACGVILKAADPILFPKCVRKVFEGEVWLPKKQVSRMAKILSEPQGSPRPIDSLTPREKLVISCLVQGWRNREIASQLSITEQTVKNHLRSIYDKVGVSDRLELVLYAIHQRLDLPPVNAGGESPA